MKTKAELRDLEDRLKSSSSILSVEIDRDLTPQAKAARAQSFIADIRRVGQRKDILLIAITT